MNSLAFFVPQPIFAICCFQYMYILNDSDIVFRLPEARILHRPTLRNTALNNKKILNNEDSMTTRVLTNIF